MLLLVQNFGSVTIRRNTNPNPNPNFAESGRHQNFKALHYKVEALCIGLLFFLIESMVAHHKPTLNQDEMPNRRLRQLLWTSGRSHGRHALRWLLVFGSYDANEVIASEKNTGCDNTGRTRLISMKHCSEQYFVYSIVCNIVSILW